MTIGPLMQISPISPSGRALPLPSMTWISTVGTGGPTDVGLRTASSPEFTVATDDDSVRP